MSTERLPWAPAGVLAGLAGLAISHAAAMVLTFREAPFTATVQLVQVLLPDVVTGQAERIFGSADFTVMQVVGLLLLLAGFAMIGQAARQRTWIPALAWTLLAAVGMIAVRTQLGWSLNSVMPVVLGWATSLAVHAALLNPLRRGDRQPELVDHERRVFMLVGASVTLVAAGVAVAGRVIGNSRRHVETSRRLLRIEGVTRPVPPPGAAMGVAGVSPWQTPTEEFFVVDTTISPPTIEPQDWRLRIHGMVEREVTLTFDGLVSRPITEGWQTLSCISNEVGGGLVGNAWWSGVRVADLLAEVGVRPGADCVLQTSQDGWTAATPLTALTDERNALLAVAMNGRPLPIEHGFPVRMIVPGLHGHVSATKWVVELEVTKFEAVEGTLDSLDWSPDAPVQVTSRIDLPKAGSDVVAGEVTFAGMAWHPHVGVAQVEVSLDGRRWEPAEIGRVPSSDTWVQWSLTLDVPAGDHVARVRAISQDGTVQSGVVRDVRPDGATGWHEVAFSAG